VLKFERHRNGHPWRMIWERYPETTYNGGIWPREYLFAKTKHTDAMRFQPDYAETNILLDALLPTGVRPIDVTHLQPPHWPGQNVPDFKVTLANEEHVFVECTRAGDPEVIRSEDNFPLLQARLSEWLSRSVQAQLAVGLRSVSFVPSMLPRAKQENAFVEEIQSFVAAEDLAGCEGSDLKPVPATYAVLRSCGTKVLVRPMEFPLVNIQAAAMCGGGPADAVRQILMAIESKRAKGNADNSSTDMHVGNLCAVRGR
jgi:hypothetical protein